MTRPATAPELALFRGSGQRSKLRVAFFTPATVYTARVNQVFSTLNKVVQVGYDTGSGTLANVKEGMTMLVGSAAGGHNKGIVRIRKTPTSSIFYVGEESDVKWADNDHLTVIHDFDLWARHLTLSGSTVLMDGDIAYSDQNSAFNPVPIMGSHQVHKLTGASVSSFWDAGESWVIGSSISAYAWTAPTASGSSGMSTATPTIAFNTLGWHVVTLVVTAANGKTTTGVRYVFVWNAANPPPSAEIGSAYGDVEAGGWQFNVTAYSNVSLSDVRDRTLAILFAESHYGSTEESIGPLEGCENILAIGRISGESIEWNPDQGKVDFTIHGAHYWFNQMKGFPAGLKMVTGTPAAWIDMQSLTVKRALFHFLYWRTTAPRVMDIFLTDDTRLLTEAAAMGAKLWVQMQEFAFNTILANLGVNRYGQLFCEIDPQIIPEADRAAIPIVMEIEKRDWQEVIPLPRVVVNETGLVDVSGVSVNTSAIGASFFSLSPGNVMMRYGEDLVVDHLAAYDAQADNNELAGLMLGWKINELPQIDVKLAALNPLFDVFPNQYAQIQIQAADTPRGIEYDGKIIPRYVAFQRGDGGYLYTEISFETETFAENSTNGEIPFSNADQSVPPVPAIPDIPFPPILLPGVPSLNLGEGPPKVLLHDTTYGLIYSENFNASGASVKWRTVNSGLTQLQYQTINKIILTRSGAIYVAHRHREGFGTEPFIAYAPYTGATFTIIEDPTSIKAKEAGTLAGVIGIGLNEATGQIGYVIGGDFGSGGTTHFYIGSGTSFAQGVLIANINAGSVGSVSFGHNNWRVTGALGTTPHFLALNAAGSSVVRDVTIGGISGFDTSEYHIPVSTSDVVLMWRSGGLIRITQNGAVAGDFTTVIGTLMNFDITWDHRSACDPSGMLFFTDWDVGRRGRSSDGGATMTGIPNLPFGDEYAYDYAGGDAAGSRWVAAHGIVRYSPDRGDTWLNKEGNINLVAPLLLIDAVKVIEF